MSQYYLISQLPSLDGIIDSVPLPITEERFSELCSRFLSKKTLDELDSLTLIPSKFSENINSTLLESWYTVERNLRFALGKLRAEKLNKSFEFDNMTLPTELLQTARTAVEFNDPLESEKFLNNFRLKALEALRPMDNFSEDYLFYYKIKLKLILRIREFDKLRGQTAYRNIYDSVINRAESEVE
ncbi:MAG: DUF2764 family protein [Clostridia bacterium]|nr:DUF2764 family protein [Clostridia bacterium]